MTSSHRGSFFAIDRRIWSKLCDSGMNAAVAYLVMACGTGRDNRTTRWSAQAIHNHSGMAWERAKAAIDGLIHDGFIHRAADHSPAKPRYELRPYSTPDEAENGGDTIIWLPNSIVTGTGKGETSPVHRLRSAGSILAMRLFVELYHAQNLRDDGGISPRIIRTSYERSFISEQGIFNVWGFKPTHRQIFWSEPFTAHEASANVAGAHPVNASIDLLEKIGLLSFIPHIFENDTPEAEILHPYGVGSKGEESIEMDIGEAAAAAARAMSPEWVISNAENDGFEHFCPVSPTMPNIEMIGIARLRYRPHTSRTAAWYEQLQLSGSQWVEKYQELAARAQTPRVAKRA